MNPAPEALASPAPALPHRRFVSDVLVPLGLIALGLIPSVAGISRLLGLVGLPSALPAEARFTADPIPIAVHAASATTFLVLGALQFSPRLRARGSRFHRIAGYVLVPAGLLAALSGLWMAAFYPFAPGSGPALRDVRFVVGAAMTLCLLLGVRSIVERDYRAHAAFMTRAYAIGLGAGTQALVLFPRMLLGLEESEGGYALAMAAGWAINALVAEWVIAARDRRGEGGLAVA